MQTRMERMQQQRMMKMRFYKKKGFIWSLITIGILLIGITSYYGLSIFRFLQGIQTPENGQQVQSAATWTGTDRVNILLLGVDNRNNDPHPRSDSMIVVSVDPVTKTARMFSIMRDSWYKIPGYGFEKINAAYALGGPDLAIQTVSSFLQIPIHYYIKTDFQGFEKVVDAVGGVTIDVEKDMDYVDDGKYDIHLKKGEQLLDGKHALMYVRFRHDALSDFARTDRQRKFLTALGEKLQTPGALVKLPSILEAIRPYVDTNMQVEDMLKLGSLAADVNIKEMKPMQIPPTDAFVVNNNMNGMSVLIPDVYKCRVAVHDALGMTDVVTKPGDDQYPLISTQPATAPLPETKRDDPAPTPQKSDSTMKNNTGSNTGNTDSSLKNSKTSGTVGSSGQQDGSLPNSTLKNGETQNSGSQNEPIQNGTSSTGLPSTGSSNNGNLQSGIQQNGSQQNSTLQNNIPQNGMQVK